MQPLNLDDTLFAGRLVPLAEAPCGPGWNRSLLEQIRVPAPRNEAAVLLAIRAGDEGPEMLFTRRNDSLSTHPGQVSFPGGRADPEDSDAVATALREAHEEIALPPTSVRPLGYLDRLDTTSGFSITPVVARILGAPRLKAQPDEVAELFSVPCAYLLKPANYGRRTIDTAVGPRRIAEIRYGDQVIWGATAMILLNLQRRLGINA